MPYVPPVVAYRTTRGAAYLIGWRQHPDGTWWARLLWVEIDDDTLRGREAWVVAADVERLPEQDYSAVPRRRHTGPPLPSDPYDPRDPGYRSRARPAVPQPEPDF